MIREELRQLATLIKDLKPHPSNVRQGDVGAISVSLEQHGQYRPIVVQKSTGYILAGNHTYKAALSLKWKEIAATYVDCDDDQALRILLIDNRANDLASYDDTALVEMLKALMETDTQLAGTGFDPSDLDQLLRDLEMDADVEVVGDPDSVPDDAPSITVLGDVWLLGKHRLMCGDSTTPTDIDKLINGATIDCLLTDPPYGINVVKKNMVGADFGVASKGQYKPIANDGGVEVSHEVLEICLPIAKESIVWGGNYFADRLPPSSSWIVWDKRCDSGIENTFADAELAWTNLSSPTRVHHQLWNGMIREGEKDKRVHPTQKPIKLIVECIKRASKPQTVLDPFGGSGSTLIAAHQTGCTAYLMELDPHYCDVICKRFQQATGITPIAEATNNEHSFIE